VQQEEDEKIEETINSEILLLSVAIPELDKIIAMSEEEKLGTKVESPLSHRPAADSSYECTPESPPGRRRVPATVAADAFSQPEAAAGGAYATGYTTARDSGPGPDQLERDTIVVSLLPLGSGGLDQDPSGTLRQALESFSHNPTVSVVGRYKCGKSTVVKKLLGYPKGKCLHHPIHNTKGLNLYIGKTPGQSVFIDVEGFAQPLTTMDPYFLRELAMQFCASVSRCIILVVNHIDITDLQLIRIIRTIAKGVIVVVHNLMTVTSKADMDEYKDQIARSMDLVPNQFNKFALSNRDNTEVHYVIGHFINDSDWNVKLGSGQKHETVFDVITRMHCNHGDSTQHIMADDAGRHFFIEVMV